VRGVRSRGLGAGGSCAEGGGARQRSKGQGTDSGVAEVFATKLGRDCGIGGGGESGRDRRASVPYGGAADEAAWSEMECKGGGSSGSGDGGARQREAACLAEQASGRKRRGEEGGVVVPVGGREADTETAGSRRVVRGASAGARGAACLAGVGPVWAAGDRPESCDDGLNGMLRSLLLPSLDTDSILSKIDLSQFVNTV